MFIEPEYFQHRMPIMLRPKQRGSCGRWERPMPVLFMDAGRPFIPLRSSFLREPFGLHPMLSRLRDCHGGEATVKKDTSQNLESKSETRENPIQEKTEESLDTEVKKQDAQPWKARIRMAGFRPDDIRVTSHDGGFCVDATHVTSQHGLVSQRRMRRFVQTPPGVEKGNVRVYLGKDGFLYFGESSKKQQDSTEDKNRPTVTTVQKGESDGNTETAEELTDSDSKSSLPNLEPETLQEAESTDAKSELTAAQMVSSEQMNSTKEAGALATTEEQLESSEKAETSAKSDDILKKPEVTSEEVESPERKEQGGDSDSANADSTCILHYSENIDGVHDAEATEIASDKPLQGNEYASDQSHNQHEAQDTVSDDCNCDFIVIQNSDIDDAVSEVAETAVTKPDSKDIDYKDLDNDALESDHKVNGGHENKETAISDCVIETKDEEPCSTSQNHENSDEAYKAQENDSQSDIEGKFAEAIQDTVPQVDEGGILGEAQKAAFRVSMDVSGFSPSDLRITVVDREVSVQAERSEDVNGVVMVDQLSRSFVLPPDVDADSIRSSMTSDGALTVFGQKQSDRKPKERNIDIQRLE